MYYLALVHADDSSIGFTIPDVPGFTADIETTDMDDAIAEATKILAAHLSAVREAGGDIRKARSIGDIRRHPEENEAMEEATCIVFLPVLIPMGRTVRINLSLDEGTLALIDREARDRGVTRSALVQAAAAALVDQRLKPGKRPSVVDAL